MNIGAVKGSAYAPGGGQQNPQLKAIDKQIGQIKKGIQELKANEKMDAKTKQEKLKQYEEQIAQLQAQKAQVQADAQKTRPEKAVANQSEQEKPDEGKDSQGVQISHKTQAGLIQMDSAMATKKQLGPVRADIEGQIYAAENGSYLEPADPEAAAKLRGALQRIDSAITEKVRKAGKTIQSGRKEKAENISGEKTNEAASSEKANNPDGKTHEADGNDKKRSGTGRMEAGQFMNEEA